MQTLEVEIHDLKDEYGIWRVTRVVKGIRGVENLHLNPEKKRLKLQVWPSKFSITDMILAIQEAGFDPRLV